MTPSQHLFFLYTNIGNLSFIMHLFQIYNISYGGRCETEKKTKFCNLPISYFRRFCFGSQLFELSIQCNINFANYNPTYIRVGSTMLSYLFIT